MISVKNLEKTFHTSRGDLPVLMGINQTIEKGEKVVIVGRLGKKHLSALPEPFGAADFR